MDSEQAMGIAREFASDSAMSAVIGLYDDTLAVRASAIFEEAKLLHLNIGVNNSYLTSHGFRYLISTVLANDKIGPSLAHYAVGQGFKSYAVVAEQGAFGEDLAFHFNLELDNLDARVVYQTTYLRGTEDFRDIVNEIRACGADMVFFAGFERESARFIRSARTMGLTTQIMGTFDNTPLVQAIAGPFLEGVWTYDYWDIDTATPENLAFVAKYRARFQEDPTSSGAQAYDALYLLASAIDHTGSVHGLDLSYALRCMNSWQGANGAYKFDLTGSLGDKMIYLYTFHHGRPMLMASNLSTLSPRRNHSSSVPPNQEAPEPQAQAPGAP
jgi:branched-chain amino acid transport system substrate-binding protein